MTQLLAILIVVGLLLYVINVLLPVDRPLTTKRTICAVAMIVAVVLLLQVSGLMGGHFRLGTNGGHDGERRACQAAILA